MEILNLIFSASGATIFVCLTLLTVLIIYLCFRERLLGIVVGYKDLKLETPKASIPTLQTPQEIIETPTQKPAEVIANDAAVESKENHSEVNLLVSLFEAVHDRNRSAIETAIDKMRDKPPLGLSADQLETFKLHHFLDAGFSDALAGLKEIEKTKTDQLLASKYLARYYLEARSFDDVKKHLKISEERAKTEKEKVDIYLLRAELIQVTSNRADAGNYLETQAKSITDTEQKFRLHRESGKLFKDANIDWRAIISYERALRCKPEDIDTRFWLALTYGAIGPLRMLGLRHYQIILNQNRANTGALNNLGLLYGDLGVPIEKVNLLKKAVEFKDAHASGNLASLYLEAGFVDDARKTLTDLDSTELITERVISAQQQLQRASTESNEKKERIATQAETLSAWISSFPINENFDAKEYLGRWNQGSGTSVILIEQLAGYFKITITDGNSKKFAYPYSLSPICSINISSDDRVPSGLLMLMDTSDGEWALLFSEKSIRLIRAREGKAESYQDFERAPT